VRATPALATTPWTRAERSLLGLLVFLATEVMFFAGLASAVLILRAGSEPWPPSGQPRLPAAVTAANIVVLLLSAVAMQGALRAARRGRSRALGRRLALAGALGVVFLGVQGAEWLRLLAHGLSATATLYGATFLTLVGAHALHVAGAMVALAVVLARAARGRYRAGDHLGVQLCGLYWWFVAALWPVLYVLVYLA
jgi:cytochrome c oxidase subunit 3